MRALLVCAVLGNEKMAPPLHHSVPCTPVELYNGRNCPGKYVLFIFPFHAIPL